MKNVRSLSLVLPAFNEEDNLQKIIPRAMSVLKKIALQYELIIVDDGSTDKTIQIATEYQRTFKEIRIIRYNRRQGHGYAIWSGLSASRFEYIFYTDSDCQFNIFDIILLIPYINVCDFILGYRLNRKDQLYRKVLSLLWRLLVKWLFNLKIRDINCAFKLFKRDVISNITINSKGAFVNTELLLKALHLGYNYVEIKVPHFPRLHGKATGGSIRVGFRAIYDAILFKI